MSLRKQVLVLNYEKLNIFKLNQVLRILHRARLDIDYWEKCLNRIDNKNKKSLVLKRLRLARESINRELQDTEQYIPEKYRNTLAHYYN